MVLRQFRLHAWDLALGGLALAPLVLAWRSLHELVGLASFTRAVAHGSEEEVWRRHRVTQHTQAFT